MQVWHCGADHLAAVCKHLNASSLRKKRGAETGLPRFAQEGVVLHMRKRKVIISRKLHHPEFSDFQKMYMKFQRGSSLALALTGGILLSPLFVGLCVWIAVDSGFPIFFRQKRVARSKPDGTYTYFTIYKFRTMYQNAPKDVPTHLLKDPDACITKAGKFLRKTSLDELPQLINIIKGDMNIIGPRPALYNQTDLMAERDRYGANFVRPGMTGLAQVMGRDELPIPVKARYDGIYAQYVGPVTDGYCFLKTITEVVRGEGVVEGGTGAMSAHRPKILILTNHSYMLYQFRRELIAKLLETCDVVLSMPFVGHEEDFQAMGCKCVRTEVDRRGINPVTDGKLLQFYDKLVEEEKPDKVITYSIKPNIYGGLVCRRRRIPYYANVQGLGTAFQKKGLAEFVAMLYRRAFGSVQTIFFENPENAREFMERTHISGKKTAVLHGAGVNLEHYAYQEYPDNGETRHFLYLGRIMKEKGVDELFEAMRRIRREYGNKAILDVVGFFEDEYKDTVKKLEADGIAVFHGFQEETRPFYGMASCVVLPSYHEGMSNVLLEAAAVGRPVITSDIPGCREAVEDGKTGWLCEVKNARMLYEKMKKVMDMSLDELSEMGKAGRRRMERLFDKGRVVEETMRVLGVE